jgi:cobalamin biosynthesis protein CbiG
MVGGEAMSNLVAIGVGCRRNCSGAVLAQLVSRALGSWPRDLPTPLQRSLFTIEDKRGDAGIHEAAEALGIELVFLSREALREAMPRTQTGSARAEALFGVGSVAEASALAGGGPNATLVVPRISENNATCAIAADLSLLLDRQP